MKPLNVLLCVVLVACLAFGAFFLAGGTLRADVNRIYANASDYPEVFASVQDVIAANSAPQLFSADPLDEPGNYSLMDVTVSLSNRGIFDAEWLNVCLEGVAGDVAVYSLTGDGSDVPARSSGQVNLKLITRAPADVRRNLSIQYYVYGISRTINVQV